MEALLFYFIPSSVRFPLKRHTMLVEPGVKREDAGDNLEKVKK